MVFVDTYHLCPLIRWRQLVTCFITYLSKRFLQREEKAKIAKKNIAYMSGKDVVELSSGGSHNYRVSKKMVFSGKTAITTIGRNLTISSRRRMPDI